MNINNLKPLLIRGLSVGLRILFIIIIPKILLTKDYNEYSLVSSLILFVSSASGLGFPVYFIKKFALNEIPKEYYLRFITPISLLSGAVFFVIFTFLLPIKLTIYYFTILFFISILEIYINDFLRLYQAESNLSKHIEISFVKSLLIIIIFSLLYVIDKTATLNKVLLSWLISNFFAAVYLNPNYKKIFFYKSEQMIFTWPIVFFSFFYFIAYLCDRFVLYYDKILFYKHFDPRVLISLNLLILANQSSYNLIESTLLLKKYNNIFNNKYLVSKKEIIELVFVIFLFSITISCFLPIFYNQYFSGFDKAIIIFFSSLSYYIISILSWYYNIRNYSHFTPSSFLILSFIAALIYMIFIYFNFHFFNSEYIIPLLYPLSYLIVHKTARLVLFR
jgi:hypothetical protein